jgi:hypothetical protein
MQLLFSFDRGTTSGFSTLINSHVNCRFQTLIKSHANSLASQLSCKLSLLNSHANSRFSTLINSHANSRFSTLMQTLASQLSCKLSLLNSHQLSCKLSLLNSHAKLRRSFSNCLGLNKTLIKHTSPLPSSTILFRMSFDLK